MSNETVTTPKRGRKRPTNIQIAEAIRKLRGNVSAAANALGVERGYIYKRINADEKLKAVLAEQREVRLDFAESALDKAIADGQGWAVCFTLKTQGKSRGYIERTQVEHLFSKMSDDELAKFITSAVGTIGDSDSGSETPQANANATTEESTVDPEPTIPQS